MNEKLKGKLQTILKITISLGLILYLVLTKVDKTEMVENFRLLDWRFIPIILLTIILNYVLSSLRWKSLLIHERSNEVSRMYLFRLYFIGAFFNNFMPTSIGGDVYKVYRLGKKIGSQATSFSSVFTERFTGILMLILIGLFSLVRVLHFGVLIPLLWLVSGFFIGLYTLRLLGTKIKFFKKIYDALIVYKDYPRVLVYAMITSILIQLMSMLAQYLTFMAVGINLPIFYSLLAFPVITLLGFFIPSINGFGVQDALYVSMFSLVGVSVNAALSVSIVYHIIRVGASLIGGIFYAFAKDS